MKFWHLLPIIPIFLNASTIDLEEILKSLKEQHPLAKSIQEISNASNYQNRASGLNEVPQLSIQNAYAKPKENSASYEYGVEFSQSVLLSGVRKNIEAMTTYKNDSNILELKNSFTLLLNEAALLYHNYCIDKSSLVYYKGQIDTFEKIYKKKSIALELGEISKKEFLELEVELDRLKNEFLVYKNNLEISRIELQGKIAIESIKNKEPSCRDLKPIVKELEIRDGKNLMEESYDKKIASYDSEAHRYSSNFDNFTYTLSYSNEIDTKRYTLSLGIPLNSISSRYELERLSAMHNKSATIYEKNGYISQNRAKVDSLTKKLSFDEQNIKIQKDIADKYEHALLPLAKNSYLLGESSLIEYLLYQRDFLRSKENLAQSYKNYYQTLFSLYSVLPNEE